MAVDSHPLLLVGAGPGLGAAIARRFAREGYRLTLVARSEAKTAPIAEESRAAGGHGRGGAGAARRAPTSPSSRPTPAMPRACVRRCLRCSTLRTARAS